MLEQGCEIGLATVYRVLNQFDEAHIVIRHNFEGNKSVFELAPTEHHDHIICEDCGKVFEFTDNIIEQRQREISEKYGIKLKRITCIFTANAVILIIVTKTIQNK